MASHALVREIAQYVETAFATSAGGPADWSTNGTYVYATDIDLSGIEQAVVANENNLIGSIRNIHAGIRALRSESSFSFGRYLHGSTTNAAEAAAATTYHLADILRSALGGYDLGWSIGFAGGSAAAPQMDADPGFAVGDWIWAYDDSAGVGHFYQITALPGGVVLTLDRDLHFTPATADKAYAVIDCFVHPKSTGNHAHAQHKTMAFLVQGEDTDDCYIMRGCKPTLTFAGFEAGGVLKAMFDVGVTTFDIEGTSLEDFSAATVYGEAGNVTGISDNTYVMMADYGSDLATVTTYGTIGINPGVGWDRVRGPNGIEGVHGWVDNLGETTLEITVPFDDAYNTAFRAKTFKHCLIEVGDTPSAYPVGVYFSRLEFASEPKRADDGALTSHALAFRGHMVPGAVDSDNAVKLRSSFHLLLVA